MLQMGPHRKLAGAQEDPELGRPIITLAKGWRFADGEEPSHRRSFDDVHEAREQVRKALPCFCMDCRSRA